MSIDQSLQSKVREKPLTAALAFFAAGLGLALILNHVGITIGDGAFIALLVVPLLVYGVAAGLVQEFTAPGGWGAKFKQTAAKEIEPSLVADLPGEITMFEKGGD